VRRTVEDIITAWLKSREYRLVPNDYVWSGSRSAVRDLASVIEDACTATPTHEIDADTLRAALEAAGE
jgi:hypothetical protein